MFDKLDNNELKKRMEKFLEKYDGYKKIFDTQVQGFDYDEDSMSIYFMIKNFYQDTYDNLDVQYNDYPIIQALSAIGAFPDDKNPYYKLAQIIGEEYGLDRDIIEVGAGFFPALAYEIAKKQNEIGKGSITVYDPWLVPKTLDGIKIVKKNFTTSTPIEKGSLIIGNKSCDATESIITNANKHNIEFYINLCSCNHTPDSYALKYRGLGINNNQAIWKKYIDEKIESTLPTGFVVEEDEFTNPLSKRGKSTVVKTKKR